MFMPVFALVGLTLTVWLALVAVRTVTPYVQRFDPQLLADDAKATLLRIVKTASPTLVSFFVSGSPTGLEFAA